MRPSPLVPLCLVAALAFALAGTASCTYDFGGAFTNQKRDAAVPQEPTGDPSAVDASDRPADVDGGCNFFDDYGLALGGPESWFRLDEATGNFTPRGRKVYGYRKAGNRRIPLGAIRAANGAQHLSGADGYIGFGDAWPELNGGDAIPSRAIELWFRLDEASHATQTLMAKIHGTGTALQGFRVVVDASRALKYERFGLTGGFTVSLHGIATGGVWHHFVAQRDGDIGSLGFYLDGEATAAFDITPSKYADSKDAFVIGPLEGDVDELAVYPRTLSDAEVKARLDAAASVHCRGRGSTPTPTTCFGPSSRATCANDQPVWSDSCKVGESCVMIAGEPRCVVLTCPE